MSDESISAPPSGESNPTEKKETEGINKTFPPLTELQPHPEEKHPIKMNVWAMRAWRAFCWAWKLFAEIVTIGWALALWDSYRPKITVAIGPTFNAKEPFASVFIIQNPGSLAIRNVSFDTTWIYADDPNQARNVNQGIAKIAQLNSLEQHAMLQPPPPPPPPKTSVNTDASPVLQNVEIVPTPIGHHSLIMWFDVTYYPRFFGKRTETLYFYGTWDSETNFQWLPTGSADVRTMSLDENLLKRALQFNQSLIRQRDSLFTNATKAQTNGSKTAATNGNSQVHTN